MSFIHGCPACLFSRYVKTHFSWIIFCSIIVVLIIFFSSIHANSRHEHFAYILFNAVLYLSNYFHCCCNHVVSFAFHNEVCAQYTRLFYFCGCFIQIYRIKHESNLNETGIEYRDSSLNWLLCLWLQILFVVLWVEFFFSLCALYSRGRSLFGSEKEIECERKRVVEKAIWIKKKWA